MLLVVGRSASRLHGSLICSRSRTPHAPGLPLPPVDAPFSPPSPSAPSPSGRHPLDTLGIRVGVCSGGHAAGRCCRQQLMASALRASAVSPLASGSQAAGVQLLADGLPPPLGLAAHCASCCHTGDKIPCICFLFDYRPAFLFLPCFHSLALCKQTGTMYMLQSKHRRTNIGMRAAGVRSTRAAPAPPALGTAGTAGRVSPSGSLRRA